MMSDKPRERTQSAKRSYEKPVLSQIQLKPEEAVLGGCKTTSGTGSLQATCNIPAPCNAVTTS
jgi:hypothetical protein